MFRRVHNRPSWMRGGDWTLTDPPKTLPLRSKPSFSMPGELILKPVYKHSNRFMAPLEEIAIPRPLDDLLAGPKLVKFTPLRPRTPVPFNHQAIAEEMLGDFRGMVPDPFVWVQSQQTREDELVDYEMDRLVGFERDKLVDFEITLTPVEALSIEPTERFFWDEAA